MNLLGGSRDFVIAYSGYLVSVLRWVLRSKVEVLEGHQQSAAARISGAWALDGFRTGLEVHFGSFHKLRVLFWGSSYEGSYY